MLFDVGRASGTKLCRLVGRASGTKLCRLLWNTNLVEIELSSLCLPWSLY